MAFNFHTYLTARNNFCYCYYGKNQEIIDKLLDLQNKLQKKYQDINVFLCLSHKIDGKNIIQKDEFKNNLFLYYEEIQINPNNDRINEIITENEL